MANDNHLFSVTCYNVTMINTKYYNEFFDLGQQKINFSFFELHLPDDYPVYTFKKVMKEMDFSGLTARYSTNMANQILDKINSNDMAVPNLPGEVPARSTSKAPGMAPSTTDECTKCGICAKKCPVGAIDPITVRVDSKKCISYMRCISVCPKNARKLNKVIDSLGGVALSVLCAKRKENEIFL